MVKSMRKKVLLLLTTVFLFLGSQVEIARSSPIDLSTFSGDAIESGGVILFEDDFSQAWYAYSDPSFFVPLDAGVLSFDYSLDLIPDTVNDYLALEINFGQVVSIVNEGSGHVSYDMESLKGQTIDLAWVLYWGGDITAQGSQAAVSNIELNPSPIPEPGTFVLFGFGMCGFMYLARKKD